MRLSRIAVLASAAVAILCQSTFAAPAPAKPEPAAPKAAAAAAAPAASAPAAPKAPRKPVQLSAFDALDDAAVARNLQELGMGELLAAMATEDANSPDVGKRAVAADIFLDQAGKVPDQKTADEMIDKAINILDSLIEDLKDATAHVEKANWFKLRMTKATAEGMGRIQKCIERMQYLLESAADRAKIVQCSDTALKTLGQMETDIAGVLAAWRADPEARVTGALYQLEELQKERRFRDGWLQFYRAAATPDTIDNKQLRGDMFNVALDTARDFLGSGGDANDPAKVPSLLLLGMASRETKKFDEARAAFKRIAETGSPEMQLRAMFEIAHTAIAAGKMEDGLAAIKAFQDKARTIPEVKKIAVDMQSALLESHLYESLGESLKKSNPIEAKKLSDKSIQVMLGFITKNPSYMQAFLDIIGPRYEGEKVDALAPQVVVALGLWHAAKNTPASAKEAERLLKDALTRKDLTDQNSIVMAMGQMGQLCESQKRYVEAADYFSKLADRFPQDAHAKPAAMQAVRCMNGVVAVQGATPTDSDLAMYLQALLVLMKHWGSGPANKDVQDYHYMLGVQLENTSKSLEAIKEYELVPTTSRLYLLAKYHALGLRATVLMDTPPANIAQRTVQAKNLIAGAAAFHDAAVAFKTTDEAQLKEVKNMGAEMDLMSAQVQLQILKQTPQARAAAEKVLKDWPGLRDITDRAMVLQVQTYLSEKNLMKAIELLVCIKENTAVMAQVVKEIRLVIERLDPVKDAEDFKSLMSVFPQFAEKVYEAARKAVAANPKAPADAMYPYTQVRALAYEYTDDKAKNKQALDDYIMLNKLKKDDAINIRGMARCYRKIGAPIEAMNCYNQLVNGLKRLSPDWWKAQLERVQFSVEINAGTRKTDEIRKVILELRRLADEDPGMGGPALKPKFQVVLAKAQEAAPGALPTSAPAKPAAPATPAPAKK